MVGRAISEGNEPAALCAQPGIPSQATARSFRDAYKRRFNREAILYAPYAYDAANVLIAAMKAAGSTDPKVYASHIRNLDLRGATGDIAFDKDGDRSRAQATVFRIARSALRPVAILDGISGAMDFEDYLRIASER